MLLFLILVYVYPLRFLFSFQVDFLAGPFETGQEIARELSFEEQLDIRIKLTYRISTMIDHVVLFHQPSCLMTYAPLSPCCSDPGCCGGGCCGD